MLELTLKVNSLTPLNPHELRCRGIFNYGNDPSGQSVPIVGTSQAVSVTPSLLTVRKSITYAENETATGPSFPGTWSLTGNIAREATLQNITFTDQLPDNFHVTSATVVRPANGVLNLSGSNPGYSLTVTWD